MMQKITKQPLFKTAPAVLRACLAATLLSTASAYAATELTIPVSRSQLISLPSDMAEVIVADPTIADVHAHGTTALSIIAKKPGQTSVRILDKANKVMGAYDITVSYDLPAMRKALKDFLPDEMIGVEMVSTNIALTGQVSNATAADKALRIAQQYVRGNGDNNANSTNATGDNSGILNLMRITSGQQVMLRVRVGEIQRSALKSLGVDIGALSASGRGLVGFATGAGIAGLVTPVNPNGTPGSSVGPGGFLYPGDGTKPTNTQGFLTGSVTSSSGDVLSGAIRALERDGLFKVLAEPNLVAISGEEAEFLAGGEIPVPVPQTSGNGSNGTTLTIEYKPFGVAVRFRPNVLSENRIRMEVQPEVSELDDATAIVLNNFRVPGLTTRRARTTVELSPGESFMIAGLIRDQTRSNIDQLPGMKELPILGALFRSTEFQRNETELVISVTPYIVDPIKGTDVKLPTDNFIPASQMEMIFYGALGTLRGDTNRISQTPSLEGPIGFMVD